MIDKETRIKILKLLTARHKRLGKKSISIIDLMSDLSWLSQNSGDIMDEINKEPSK